MELMVPTDSLYLFAESRDHPMHVGALSLYRPPAGAGADFVQKFTYALIANDDIQPTFRKRPARILGQTDLLAWTHDDQIDINYHVRHVALPAPGRLRDMLELTSRLHTGLLDRHRPLWEAYVIEGLEDGRFGVYIRVHHSLIDGAAAARLLERAMSVDPDDTEVRAMWSLPELPRPPAERSSPLGALTRLAGSVAGLPSSTVRLARSALVEQQLTLPFGAPRTMFNVKIGGARRFVAQSWALERVLRVKRAAGVSFNDAVLAMCAGALRYYLLEQDALPDAPLIALVPVSLRPAEDTGGGGNKVGAILCNLGTDVEDPAERLDIISAAMQGNKEVLAELPKAQVVALSAMSIVPLGLSDVPGFVSTTPPPFNLVISNVPGPSQQMYYGGARMEGSYPLSHLTHGQAFNITFINNADKLDFGLLACRDSTPHLSRMLEHLETSLADLERAIGA
jgi:diacylglycerol O-acyltransferase / wax synthase